MGQDRSTDAEPFTALLRTFRERAGLTQEELAERAGLTPHAISALERGTRTRPYPHTVRALAGALGMSDVEVAHFITAVPRRQTSSSNRVKDSGALPTPQPGPGQDSVFMVPPTRLYGRDRDIAEAAELVRSRTSRLITLTGPGGVGKTRLAAALTDTLGGGFSDGVLVVPLAAVADALDVIGTIGRAMEVPGSDQGDALAVITRHLGRARMLLVLDNFEHLMSAAPTISQLVAGCPTLTVLVTSRSPLRVRGEHEVPVGPLELPPRDVTSPELLAEWPAGAFVLDRARNLSAQLILDQTETRALADLCHRLAGLPLAIELATAHLRLLAPQTLLDRLEQLTAGGARDLPSRQRTMRATLDWSHRLLTPDQQRLFSVLSVFRGGATLAIIEQVAAGSGMFPAGDVLSLLEVLVEQSLVVVQGGGAGERRFDMLEPVAQYARGLLLGDAARRVAAAHADTFLHLAEAAAAGYQGADQVLWLQRVEADEANIVVAIDRALDQGDGETAGLVTWAMWLYWWLRSQPSIGLRRALRCLTVELPPAVLARVHLTAATMSYAGGDLVASGDHWHQAFVLGTEQHDPEIACAGRAGTGLAALGAGDLDLAETCFREALVPGLAAGESGVWLRSLIHVWLGTALMLNSHPGGAVEEMERGLQLARQRGDRLATYVALYNIAQVAIGLEDHDLARACLVEGIELSHQTHDLANLAYFLEALAVVESTPESSERIAVLLGAAQSLRAVTGGRIYGYYLPDESLRARADADAREALGEDGFEAAQTLGRTYDLDEVVHFALA